MRDFFVNFAESKTMIEPICIGYNKENRVPQYNSLKNSYILHIITHGMGYYIRHKKHYELRKGNMFLIAPGDLVHYYPNVENTWGYLWVGFNGEDAIKLISQFGLNLVFVGQLKSLDGILELAQMVESYRDETVYPSLFLETIFCLICQEITKNTRQVNTYSLNTPSILNEAVNYIVNHYQTTNVNQWAQHMSMDRTTLFKLIKRHAGISPQDYLMQYKLRVAENLINATKEPITDIAEKSGFGSYAHFSRCFKTFFGISATKMRSINAPTQKA